MSELSRYRITSYNVCYTKLLRLTAAAGVTNSQLPCIFFPDGSTLPRPGNLEIAARVGLQTVAENPLYDLVIVSYNFV